MDALNALWDAHGQFGAIWTRSGHIVKHLGHSGVFWRALACSGDVLGMFLDALDLLWEHFGTICARVEDILESAGNDFEISFRLDRAI